MLVDGFSLAGVPSDTRFTFSGAVRTNNAAWSIALLVNSIEVAPDTKEQANLVLPHGAFCGLGDVASMAPLMHMQALQQVRCTALSHARAFRTASRVPDARCAPSFTPQA